MTKQRTQKPNSQPKKIFRDLKNRTWIAIFLSLAALLLIYFANQPFVQVLLTIVLAVFISMALFECILLLEKKRSKIPRKLVFGFTWLWILSCYLSVMQFNMMAFNMLIIALFVFLVFLSNFRSVINAVQSISATIFSIIYVVIPLSLILYIVYPHSMGIEDDGRMWLAYLIVVTKMTDIGGYFIGKMWGKHKMAPHLSPKKTLEGALGGLCLAVLSSIAFFIVGWLIPATEFSLSLFQSIMFGLILGIIGQLGDLTESLFKRDAHIKDSNTLPGLGGVLDLLDSLIFTAPTLFLFMRIL